jgi:acyl carrier protein
MRSDIFRIDATVLRKNIDELDEQSGPPNTDTWDSVAHIALVSQLEEELGIDIPIEDIPEIQSLGQIIEYAHNQD